MGDDYTQDEDIMNEIADAKAYSYGGKTQVKKHGTDLHVLVAAKANPSTIWVGLESPNFRAFINAKNDDGVPIPVPGLLIENEVQLRRFCEGRYLKKLSLEKRNILRSDLKEHNVDVLVAQCSEEKCKINF